MLAAVVMYLPALRSGFLKDDYTYLYSVKTLSVWQYARTALAPESNNDVLTLTRYFWRPLYYLSFEGTVRLFGEDVLLYHLLNLCMHLCAVALVWALARRLSGRWEAAAIACTVFALHPAGQESVSWISSVNSAALPLALGAWFAFIAAVESSEVTRRRLMLAASVVLLALALGFRETAVVVAPGIVLWYFFVSAHGRLREPRTWRVLLPYIVLGVVYLVLKTRFFTIPLVNAHVSHVDRNTPGKVWYYLKLGLFPFANDDAAWRVGLQRAGGALILATIPVAAAIRRPLLTVLLTTFALSVLPYAPLPLGVSSRYFYFPSAFLALALGGAAVDLLGAAAPRMARFNPLYVTVGAVALLLVAGTYIGNRRVHDWTGDGPAVHQAWVDQLRARYPTLPAGGALYTANTPFLLTLFDNAALIPTIRYYYPQVAKIVPFDPAELSAIQAGLSPNDRIFIYEPRSAAR
jgi:hypothetical protein